MRVPPAIFMAMLALTINHISHCQPSKRKVVIINEVKVSPAGKDGKFIELKSEDPNIVLDNYFLVIMDFGRDRNSQKEETFRVKGALKLSGKQMSGRLGFIGKKFS